MKLYIGLDVHSRTSTFYALDGTGKEVKSGCIPTQEKVLAEFLNELKGEKHLCFEEGNLSRWLYVVLKPHVDQLIVCSAQHLRRGPRVKTDLLDAKFLADELRHGNINPVYHDENNYLIELRGLVSAYDALTKDIVRVKNRFKAVYRSQGLEASGTKIFSKKNLKSALNNEVSEFNAKHLSQQLEKLLEIKAQYIELFEQNIKAHKTLKLLTSIPSISTVRAHYIAAITCDAKRFKTKHQYWSYAMLVRHVQISGGRGYGFKTVHARADLKAVFMGCAVTHLAGNTQFKKYYDRLRSAGLTDQKAKKSLARKTAAIALAVMRTQKEYVDNWQCLEKKIYQKKAS